MANLIHSQVIQAPRQQKPKEEEKDPLGWFRLPATVAGMFFPPVGMALSAYDTIRTGDPRNLMGMLGGLGSLGGAAGAAGAVGGKLGGAAGSMMNPFMNSNPFMMAGGGSDPFSMLLQGSQFNPGGGMFARGNNPFQGNLF